MFHPFCYASKHIPPRHSVECVIFIYLHFCNTPLVSIERHCAGMVRKVLLLRVPPWSQPAEG